MGWRAMVAQVRETRAAHPALADEARLLERIRARDLAAFEILYRRYHPQLTRFLGLMRRGQMVEEVLNDTMLVVWERPDSFRGNSRLSTWLFAIAYRKAMKAMKRYDVPVEDNDAGTRSSADPDPEQRAGSVQAGHALAHAIAALSPPHRAVVT